MGAIDYARFCSVFAGKYKAPLSLLSHGSPLMDISPVSDIGTSTVTYFPMVVIAFVHGHV